jgi:hypothetical protein
MGLVEGSDEEEVIIQIVKPLGQILEKWNFTMYSKTRHGVMLVSIFNSRTEKSIVENCGTLK